jgi:hypothetical protein
LSPLGHPRPVFLATFLDRIIRVIVGIVLLALGVLGVAAGVWMWLAYIFGAILLLTGIIGFCPLYTLLKFSTKKN